MGYDGKIVVLFSLLWHRFGDYSILPCWEYFYTEDEIDKNYRTVCKLIFLNEHMV